MKYNSMIYTSETIKHPGMMGVVKMLLSSKDYSLKDIFHTYFSSFKLTYTQGMIEDFAKINLDLIREINVPVFFLHGTRDVHVHIRPVEEFFKDLNAPHGKQMVMYDNSSHMFHPEDAREIEKYIIESVKIKVV